jgi:hypothetical protein
VSPGLSAGAGGFVRQSPVRFGLRVTAIAFGVVYLGWNAYWLSRGQFAPSLLKALTGLPAPTTGMTRGLHQLWLGHWCESLRWHPLAVPLLVWFVFSLGWLAVARVCRQELLLPRWVYHGWAVLLLGGWLLKFVLGPAYW